MFSLKKYPCLAAIIQFLLLTIAINILYISFNLLSIKNLASDVDSFKEAAKIYTNYCGEDYYFSLIKLDKKTKKFYFDNVYGCSKSKDNNDCFFSVKDNLLNYSYNKKYEASDNLYNFFNKFQDLEVAFYKSPEYLGYSFKEINQILSSTNKEIKTISLSKYQDNKSIYIVTSTSVSNLKKCNRKKLNIITLSLAQILKNNNDI